VFFLYHKEYLLVNHQLSKQTKLHCCFIHLSLWRLSMIMYQPSILQYAMLFQASYINPVIS